MVQEVQGNRAGPPARYEAPVFANPHTTGPSEKRWRQVPTLEGPDLQMARRMPAGYHSSALPSAAAR